MSSYFIVLLVGLLAQGFFSSLFWILSLSGSYLLCSVDSVGASQAGLVAYPLLDSEPVRLLSALFIRLAAGRPIHCAGSIHLLLRLFVEFEAEKQLEEHPVHFERRSAAYTRHSRYLRITRCRFTGTNLPSK